LKWGSKRPAYPPCLGNALNFGVIENVPERREEIRTGDFSGLSVARYHPPNIRFELKRAFPNTVTRTDSSSSQVRAEHGERYHRSLTERRAQDRRAWNLAKLSIARNPLVAFTAREPGRDRRFHDSVSWPNSAGSTASRGWPRRAPIPFSFSLSSSCSPACSFSRRCTLASRCASIGASTNLRHSPVSREALGSNRCSSTRLAAHRRVTQVVEAPIEAQRLAKVQRRENEHAGEQDELNENENGIGARLGQPREAVRSRRVWPGTESWKAPITAWLTA